MLYQEIRLYVFVINKTHPVYCKMKCCHFNVVKMSWPKQTFSMRAVGLVHDVQNHIYKLCIVAGVFASCFEAYVSHN